VKDAAKKTPKTMAAMTVLQIERLAGSAPVENLC
jgi:hypothetical protein